MTWVNNAKVAISAVMIHFVYFNRMSLEPVYPTSVRKIKLLFSHGLLMINLHVRQAILPSHGKAPPFIYVEGRVTARKRVYPA